MASWRYEICLLMLKKYFTHSLRSLNIFQHSKINFVSPHGHIRYILIQIGMDCVTTTLHKDKLKALKQRVK